MILRGRVIIVVTGLLLAGGLVCAARPAPRAQTVAFPLTPGTRWTYHLHEELGVGVSFGPEDAKLAKGNVLDTSVHSEAGRGELISGLSYVRIDSTRNGRAWLSEWYRVDAQGLFVAKRVEDGQPTVLDPPQKWLSVGLRSGETWDWRAADAPISMHTAVVGEERVTVPAGVFQAVKLSSDMTVQGQVVILVHQDRWFVPGTGFVKLDTTTTAASHLLTTVALTLERFDRSQRSRAPRMLFR
jgi:hypothetical protein